MSTSFVQVMGIMDKSYITFLISGKEYTYFCDAIILSQLVRKYMKYKPGTLLNEVKRLGELIDVKGGEENEDSQEVKDNPDFD